MSPKDVKLVTVEVDRQGIRRDELEDALLTLEEEIGDVLVGEAPGDSQKMTLTMDAGGLSQEEAENHLRDLWIKILCVVS